MMTIAGRELASLDPLAVHEGAVTAFQVAKLELNTVLTDDAVLARDGRIADRKQIGGAAADGEILRT